LSGATCCREELDTAIRLWGIRPGPAEIRLYEIPYRPHGANLGCTPSVEPGVLDVCLDPGNRPAEVRGLARELIVPSTPGDCTEEVVALLERQCDDLGDDEHRLRT
jgi:hypothetical protein